MPTNEVSSCDLLRPGACNLRFIGRLGIVKDLIEDACGATPGDPMLGVRFSDGSRDGFWAEELALVLTNPSFVTFLKKIKAGFFADVLDTPHRP